MELVLVIYSMEKNGILGSTLAKIEVKEEYLEIIYKYLDYYNEEIKRNNTVQQYLIQIKVLY